MKGPRFYSAEERIFKSIDRTNHKIKVRRRCASIWWKRYRAGLESFDGTWGRSSIQIARDNSEHYTRLADQIEATTLRKLKNKLAEFRTVPLSEIGRQGVAVK